MNRKIALSPIIVALFIVATSILFHSCTPDSMSGSIEPFTVNGVSFDMVYVEGGTFTMGGTSEQGSDVFDREKPTHKVKLSSFYISKYEVTQRLWNAVMNNDSTSFEGENFPQELMYWDEIQTFITKLNRLTGRTFALPTEAQWEYAARGGNKSMGYKYPGSDTLENVAWFGAKIGSGSRPVGTKSPNELGLYDMSGNVAEWCQDWYGVYSKKRQMNPKGPEFGNERVCRGGSYFDSATNCRISYRDDSVPTLSFFTGIRLVLLPIDAQSAMQSVDTQTAKRSIASKTPKQYTATAGSTQTFEVKGVSFEMVKVKGGTFTMGGTIEQGCDVSEDENPTHKVRLSSYSIGKYEVTQALWEAVMGNNPCSIKGDSLPVSNVSWDEIQTFITELNCLTGMTFALPTEAQWEYAARGGRKSEGYKYAGSDSLEYIAWASEIFDGSITQAKPVGSKSPNELELYDMTGNVEEWCQDWYGAYSSERQTNPTGPESGFLRVLRGGCFNGFPNKCRVSSRNGANPAYGYGSGFRIALLP